MRAGIASPIAPKAQVSVDRLRGHRAALDRRGTPGIRVGSSSRNPCAGALPVGAPSPWVRTSSFTSAGRLSRLEQRRVERLITIARQVLKEDGRTSSSRRRHDPQHHHRTVGPPVHSVHPSERALRARRAGGAAGGAAVHARPGESRLRAGSVGLHVRPEDRAREARDRDRRRPAAADRPVRDRVLRRPHRHRRRGHHGIARGQANAIERLRSIDARGSHRPRRRVAARRRAGRARAGGCRHQPRPAADRRARERRHRRPSPSSRATPRSCAPAA